MKKIRILARSGSLRKSSYLQLGNILPIRNFDELKSLRGKEYSGDALYDQLIKDAADATRRRGPMFDPEGCFVAGTLVHTKDGLRAIEEIQVGDWVLAKDESGQGETAYKRVRETHRFEDKEIWYLEFAWCGSRDKRPDNEEGFLLSTRNHPFWVKGVSRFESGIGDYLVKEPNYPVDTWLRADLLEPGMMLELANGQMVEVTKSLYLAQTGHKHIAFIQGNGFPGSWQYELDGRAVEFTTSGPVTDLKLNPSLIYNDDKEGMGEEFLFPVYRTTVYNFEVEDFHTYFVGEMGVWVHNTNC